MNKFNLILVFCVSLSVFASELEIMTYNVENLFDTEKTVGKNDWAFTPDGTAGKNQACSQIRNDRYRKECFLINWTDKKLEKKINQIKKVVTKDRKLPDFLALTEIESEVVLNQLAEALGYQGRLITDSPDKRGVDVALLYNLPEGMKFVESHEYKLVNDYFKKSPTRNILEAIFELKGEKLSLFVNHWPSQGQKNTRISRMVAADKLMAVVNKRKALDPDHHIIATGDFNTISSDHPHPFKDSLYRGQYPLKNLHDVYMKDRSISWDVKNKMPLGTYFYIRGMTWNLLDAFFVSSSLLDKKGIDVQVSSYQIYAPSFITRTFKYDRKGQYNYGTKVKGVPKFYEHELPAKSRKQGYSDHFPIIMKIKY